MIKIRDREAKALIRNRIICITTIDGVAGKARFIAKIFPSPETIGALASGPTKPWNTDAIADVKPLGAFAFFFNYSHDFMARYQGKFRLR